MPRRPAPPTQPPQVYGDWQIIEDPVAPPYGHVVTDGQYRIWAAGYPSLPFGQPPDPDADFINPAGIGYEPDVWNDGYILSIQRIPTNDCVLADLPEPEDLEAFERTTSEFVNCVVDSWRPIAEEIGVELADWYPVRHCDRPEQEDYIECRPEFHRGAGWWNDYEKAVYITSTWPWVPGRDLYTEGTLTHEIGHLIQSEMNKDHVRLLEPSTMWPSDTVSLGRVTETQAECLAIGMLAKPGMTRGDFHQLGHFIDADESHWSRDSIEYWSPRALEGYVGDCNTWFAQAYLTAWS